jgi:hypothetical protein
MVDRDNCNVLGPVARRIDAIAVADCVVDRPDPPFIDDPPHAPDVLSAPDVPNVADVPDSPDRSDLSNAADVKDPSATPSDERCVCEILSCMPFAANGRIDNAVPAAASLTAVSLRVILLREAGRVNAVARWRDNCMDGAALSKESMPVTVPPGEPCKSSADSAGFDADGLG